MAGRTGPIVITDKDDMRKWCRMMKSKGKTIALVPTMGYLHKGHLSLINVAQTRAHIVVVSIYVNPGQFSPNEDLSTYPTDFLADLDKLTAIKVDAVFHPSNLYHYPANNVAENKGKSLKEDGKVVSCVEEGGGAAHETWVRVEKLERDLCGKTRPIFFRGVATIVTKLFNIVEPDVAAFGKKDYQQWKIIQRMVRKGVVFLLHCVTRLQVRDLDFPIEIIGGEIVREEDGLAMSSRNVRLSREERRKALSISRSLLEARSAVENGRRETLHLKSIVCDAIGEAGGRVDYAEVRSVWGN